MGRGSGSGGGGGGRGRAGGGGGGGADEKKPEAPTGAPAAAPAPTPAGAGFVDHLFNQAKAMPGAENNMFSIADLHAKFPGMPLAAFQDVLTKLRADRQISLETLDGRHGKISAAENAASINREGRSYAFVTFRGAREDHLGEMRAAARAERAKGPQVDSAAVWKGVRDGK